MAQQHVRPPFSSYSSSQSQLAYAGPMSYNPSMHGSTSGFSSTLPSTPFPALTDPSTLPLEPTYHDISVATHKQIATLQAKLDQKLGPEYISQRPGPGGGPKLTYAEGWKIINLANEVFGFNGWSSSICSLSIDYIDPHDEGRRWNCGVSAVVRVTLRDGVYHEDVGYGVAENIKSKGIALDKCKKEAVTDAIKRTLRNFGNLLGNCLYDKQYTQEVVKIKVQPPKFDRNALHRRPEFEQGSRGSERSTTVGVTVGSADATGGSCGSAQARDMPPPPPPQRSNAPSLSVHVKPDPDPGAAGSHSRAHPHSKSAANAQTLPQRGPVPPQPVRYPAKMTPIASTTSVRHPRAPALAPSIDLDDGSYFNSDDDALFMQLDMEGAGCMSLEEDRPIEYSEAESERGVATGANGDPEGALPSRGQQPASISSSELRYAPAPNTNNDSIQPVMQEQNHSHIQNAQRHQPQQQLQADQQKPQQQHRLLPNQINRAQHHRPPHELPKQAQNPTKISSRPAAPIGGFHFPAGVDPSRSLGTPPIAAQGISRKRNADTMSSAETYRDPGRGRTSMPHGNDDKHASVEHGDGSGSRRQREPLAPLEVEDSGNVKRLKR